MFLCDRPAFDKLQSAASFAIAQQASPRRPKSKNPARDLAIFKLVTLEHQSHEQVAEQMGTTRSRVTQIVSRVRQELAAATAAAPELKDHLARERYEQSLEKLRLEHILQTAAAALKNDPRALTSRRSGQRDRDGSPESWDETTVREQPLNVQLLKTCLRAVEGLRRLRQSASGNPEDQPKPMSPEEMFAAIYEVLQYWWTHAQLSPDPPSREFLDMVSQFQVNTFLWLQERRKGTPSALAWPRQPANTTNMSASEVNHKATGAASDNSVVTITPPSTYLPLPHSNAAVGAAT